VTSARAATGDSPGEATGLPIRQPTRHTETVGFTTEDGLDLHLVHIVGKVPATKGPILLVHGAGVRASIFQPPTETTLVDALIDDGYDVWLENWRASIDVVPTAWTLDEAALYDHPAAVQTVLEATGTADLKAIVHCQGSTSFVMAAVAGLLPEVTTIVSNAVSLHPVIPRFSRFKIRWIAPIIRRLTPVLNPGWGLKAPNLMAKLLVGFVRLTHRECDRNVCRMVSFTYGTGFPALWSHHQLNDETHRWVDHEFGVVPFTFFSQMARCVARGHLVSVSGLRELPESFVATPPRSDARFVFLAGTDNHCFLPESQVRTFAFFEQHDPGRHTLHLLDGYGHLDVFMGKNAGRDIFPLILNELDR